MQGFYSGAEISRVRTPLTLVAECGSCGAADSDYCHTPKMIPAGKGKKGILIVSEGIGRDEDRAGGWKAADNATSDLERYLRRAGVDLWNDCWLTAATICYGADEVKRSVDFCRPNVLNFIRAKEPTVIILLGAAAVKSVIGHVWKEDVGGIGRWTGFNIPLRKWNCWVCPTHHPGYIHKMEDEVLNREWLTHLREAVSHDCRPWEKVPDDSDRVELIYDPNQAAKRIRIMMEYAGKNTMIAFDYETTCLKPDSKEAEIVCCSLSDGGYTFAFPWEPASEKLMTAFREFVQSPIPKVSSNCFSGDTKLLTKEYGTVAFNEVVGETVTVLNHAGRWVPAKIRNFGVQKTHEITFVRRNYKKTIRCTLNHRWMSAEDGAVKTTDQLKRKRYKKGQRNNTGPDRVPYLTAPKNVTSNKDYRAGIIHGIVYGDGSTWKMYPKKFRVRLCGEKKELLQWFQGIPHKVTYPKSSKGDPHVHLPEQKTNLKALPIGVSDSYLIGFVRGLLATDGCVDNMGSVKITGSKEMMEWCFLHLERVGYLFQRPLKAEWREGGFNFTREHWNVFFSRDSVDLEDLLRKKHRNHYRPTNLGPYKFSSLSDEFREEDVYCAVVPSTHSFTLADGLVTLNCDMEERWTRKFVGCSVEGWIDGHDTMLDAHALDPRGGAGGTGDKKQKGITGIKFQAFVRLGIESYDDEVRPYLMSGKGSSGNTPNRIREVPMEKILRYCGLDSYYEHRVAKIQRRIR